jgi:hypothetical protein
MHHVHCTERPTPLAGARKPPVRDGRLLAVHVQYAAAHVPEYFQDCPVRQCAACRLQNAVQRAIAQVHDHERFRLLQDGSETHVPHGFIAIAIIVQLPVHEPSGPAEAQLLLLTWSVGPVKATERSVMMLSPPRRTFMMAISFLTCATASDLPPMRACFRASICMVMWKAAR